ncbi:MAG: hypothetical protein ABUT20_01675 [Bacteroidota bacterium]
MEYLLFVAYLIFFSWLVTKVKFFTRSGLSQPQLIIVFLLKVMAGIFYGWIGLYYGNLAQMVDTWDFHYNGIREYHLLFNNPNEYFVNIFRDNYKDGVSKFFASNDSYWNDLKGNVVVKVLSVFNIFTLGYYYVNVIFQSFITLLGPIAVYRVMTDVFPNKKISILLAIFLVPSFLYWTSGIHKEGLIFTGMGLVIYSVYFGVKENKFGIKRILSLVVGLLLILALRNFLIVIIVPAILVWVLSNRWPKYNLAFFCSIYFLLGVLFFTVRYISPRLDFPQAVVDKQQAFIKLQGGISSIPIRELEPNAISFLRNTPQAINLSTLRPFPADVHHILSLAAAIEIDSLLFLFLLFLLSRKNNVRSKNFILFCIFFSFSFLLAIGFSVNNLGAIVRYRSIILPLLVVPMIAQIDWKKIESFFLGNNKTTS